MIHPTSATTKFIPLAMAAVLALAACGGSDESSVDTDEICRVAQRLVDDAADLDADGVDRQLDRLADVDGIGELTDLGELEGLVRDADERSLDDAIDQLDADAGCDLDVPVTADSAPDTVADPTPPTAPAETAPATEPVPETVPETTTAPTTEAPTDSTPRPQEGGAPVVEIGATGPGIDRPDVIEDAPEAVAASGITQIPIAAGDAGVLEYRVDYSVDTFSDEPAYSASESITYIAATESSIDDVRTAFVDAIANGDVEYESTDSTSTRDTVSTTATSLRPVDFGSGPRYDVFVSSNSDVPGVAIIEIDLSDSRDGALPDFIAPATERLGDARAIGEGMGWDVRGWSWSPGVNQFSGEPFTSGGIDWSAGTGAEGDVAPLADALLADLPAPDYEDVSADSAFYTFGDEDSWSLRFSDAFEGEELRVSYDYTA